MTRRSQPRRHPDIACPEGHQVVAPAPGRRVRDPAGTVLTGPVAVPDLPYWARRLQDGDIILQPGSPT